MNLTHTFRYDLAQTPLPQALAHEARRVLGDRLQASPGAAAAVDRALAATLSPMGRLGPGGGGGNGGTAAGGVGGAEAAAEYYSTMGVPLEERLKAAAAGGSCGI